MTSCFLKMNTLAFGHGMRSLRSPSLVINLEGGHYIVERDAVESITLYLSESGACDLIGVAKPEGGRAAASLAFA